MVSRVDNLGGPVKYVSESGAIPRKRVGVFIAPVVGEGGLQRFQQLHGPGSVVMQESIAGFWFFFIKGMLWLAAPFVFYFAM